ncbi:MAG: hypothetical protein JNM00_09490 [Flavobacteriales bacterium]|nr:hypothetical protein [Flavobacteriales bacterium]
MPELNMAEMMKEIERSFNELIFTIAGGKPSEISELERMEVRKFYRLVKHLRSKSKSKTPLPNV